MTYSCGHLHMNEAGRPARTYIQQLSADTGCSPEDLQEAMDDREGWRERFKDICANGVTLYIYIYIYIYMQFYKQLINHCLLILLCEGHIFILYIRYKIRSDDSQLNYSVRWNVISVCLSYLIILSCHEHRYPWPSLATSPYRSSPLAGLQGYIPYPHIAAECMFGLVVLLLPGHMRGSIGEHHLWARPCISSSVLHVWFV